MRLLPAALLVIGATSLRPDDSDELCAQLLRVDDSCEDRWVQRKCKGQCPAAHTTNSLSDSCRIVSPGPIEIVLEPEVDVIVECDTDAEPALAVDGKDARTFASAIDPSGDGTTVFTLNLQEGRHLASVGRMRFVFLVLTKPEHVTYATAWHEFIQERFDGGVHAESWFLPCQLLRTSWLRLLRQFKVLTRASAKQMPECQLGHEGTLAGCALDDAWCFVQPDSPIYSGLPLHSKPHCSPEDLPQIQALATEICYRERIILEEPERKALFDSNSNRAQPVRKFNRSLYLDRTSDPKEAERISAAVLSGESQEYTPMGSTAAFQRTGNCRGPVLSPRHPTCAVVGSSANLLGARHGRAIDNTSAVFRVNAAPVPRTRMTRTASHLIASQQNTSLFMHICIRPIVGDWV